MMLRSIVAGLAVSALSAACDSAEQTPGTSDATATTDAVATDASTSASDGADPVADAAADTSALADATSDDATATTDIAVSDVEELPHFSFFVTSLRAMQELSGSADGFGGDLRFGETGPGAGLRGADLICATIAEKSMPGAGAKGWHAFLSAVEGEDGEQVDAIDRIGDGPWYDRLGRVVAAKKDDLLADRPTSADPAVRNDFPNEDGVPNHQPDPNQPEVDNHDTLTGSNEEGRLYSATATCLSWTGGTGDKTTEGKPRVGHSWPRQGGPPNAPGMPGDMGNPANWMSSLTESGCAPGVNLIETGPPSNTSNTVGSGGGYGGIYCFADVP